MSKELYIKQTFVQWSHEVQSELREMLIRRKIRVSDDLLDSITTRFYEAATGYDARMDLLFAEWGRMVDMGAGRKRADESIESNGMIFDLKSGRKPNKWYSRTLYGMFNRLLEDLLYGYTEDAAARLKEVFE